MPHDTAAPPDVLADTILRRLSTDRLVIWLVGSRALDLRLMLHPSGQPPRP